MFVYDILLLMLFKLNEYDCFVCAARAVIKGKTYVEYLSVIRIQKINLKIMLERFYFLFFNN